MTDLATPTSDPTRFLGTGSLPRLDPSIRIGLRLADRPLVAPGQPVEPGQPLVGRFRDQEAIAIPTSAAVVGMRPGDTLDQIPIPPEERRGRTDGAAGHGAAAVRSPVSGFIEHVTAGRGDVRAQGVGIVGAVAWGRPTAGRVVIAADGPSSEVRTTTIDVGAAGAVLVVGARIDVEAISRARAIGVAAIIAGGVAGRDLRQLDSSELRQQAALHSAAPFAFLALGGFGRAAIPGHLWDLLVAADGRTAGVVADDQLLVVGGDPAPLLEAAARPPGTVRVADGRYRDREGRIVGLAGPRRWPSGQYAPGGFVELDDPHVGRERVCLPMSALERLA